MKKIGFHFRIQPRKANLILKLYSWDLFLQASVSIEQLDNVGEAASRSNPLMRGKRKILIYLWFQAD